MGSRAKQWRSDKKHIKKAETGGCLIYNTNVKGVMFSSLFGSWLVCQQDYAETTRAIVMIHVGGGASVPGGRRKYEFVLNGLLG